MADEKKIKVKVKGPAAGYRSLGQYFGPVEKAIEVTEKQLAELRTEGVLMIVELPDDYDIAAEAPKPEPSLKDLLALCKALVERVSSAEGQISDLQAELEDAKSGFEDARKSFDRSLARVEQLASELGAAPLADPPPAGDQGTGGTGSAPEPAKKRK